MKRLLPITLTVLSLSLVGCGEESDSPPADGRDFDAEGYTAPGPYTGRVIDGYLRNARVWLDLDGDGQYSPGPLTIENQGGTEVVLASGEPTALTGQDGLFSLDVSELVQDPLVSPNLDPNDYPVIALVLPGQTIEQRSSGDVVLNEAFMMRGLPGSRNVTPLSTLLSQRNVNGLEEFLAGTTDLAAALGGVNLLSDYVRSGDHRAHAYARAIARFLSMQFPDPYEDLVRAGDGTERYLSEEAIRLMGISLANNALAIIEAVDAAAGGDYASVDIQSLDLPQVDLELNDDKVLDKQIIRARSGSLPSTFIGIDVLAELDFDYGEDGRLLSISANGCMKPNLREIARLINADGKIADSSTQWIPTITLNQDSGTFYDEEGADERITFDWESQTAAFETTTTCHDGLASSSELGGPAAIEYSWELNGGQVSSLTATSASQTQVFVPDYTYSNDFFFGFTKSVNSVDEQILALDPTRACLGEVQEDDLEMAQVVTAVKPYAISGTVQIPASFTDLELELDTRDEFFRPLRFALLDEEVGLSSTDGFQWSLYYPERGDASFVPEQPNLLQFAYLNRYRGSNPCGRDFGSAPVSYYARVEYSYVSLSDYLAGQVAK